MLPGVPINHNKFVLNKINRNMYTCVFQVDIGTRPKGSMARYTLIPQQPISLIGNNTLSLGSSTNTFYFIGPNFVTEMRDLRNNY